MLDEIARLEEEGRTGEILIPVDRVFTELGACSVLPEADRLAHNGNVLRARDLKDLPEAADRFRLYDSGGTFIGIYERRGELLRPEKVFL